MKAPRTSYLAGDTGLTLLEVVLTLLVLGLILPAVFTAYMTATRASELTLARLRCISVGRQEVETMKATGFGELWASAGDDFARITAETDYRGTGVSVSTDIRRQTLEAEDGVTADAVHMRIEASKGSVTVPFDFLLVAGGY